jgi:hypothetical protein
MPDTVTGPHVAHVEAVESLVAGRPEDTVRLLKPLADAGGLSFETRLALTKAYLLLDRGEEASRELEVLTAAGPPPDKGLHAYLGLLDAWASALASRPEDALRQLDEVGRIDPRMERAARRLRLRIEKGEPAAIRF